MISASEWAGAGVEFCKRFPHLATPYYNIECHLYETILKCRRESEVKSAMIPALTRQAAKTKPPLAPLMVNSREERKRQAQTSSGAVGPAKRFDKGSPAQNARAITSGRILIHRRPACEDWKFRGSPSTQIARTLPGKTPNRGTTLVIVTDKVADLHKINSLFPQLEFVSVLTTHESSRRHMNVLPETLKSGSASSILTKIHNRLQSGELVASTIDKARRTRINPRTDPTEVNATTEESKTSDPVTPSDKPPKDKPVGSPKLNLENPDKLKEHTRRKSKENDNSMVQDSATEKNPVDSE